MKANTLRAAFAILLTVSAPAAQAKLRSADQVKGVSKLEVQALIEPLLQKYCGDQCKLLSIDTDVELVVPDEVAPGFDELNAQNSIELAPSIARVKVLIDEMIGPVSRDKMLNLVKEHLTGLKYPVTIETKVTRFPQPINATRKVAELRARVSQQFKDTLSRLFDQFCPNRCLLGDFELNAEQVNLEEAQYGSAGEFFQDGDIAIRVANIGGTLLLDNSLTPEERAAIAEMARLKTSDFKHVTLKAQALKFPEADLLLGEGEGRGGRRGRGLASASSSREESELKKNQTSDSQAKTSLSESANATSSTTAREAKNSNETSNRTERYERLEKVERVESGDAVQKQIKELSVWALVFAASVMALLVFIAMAAYRAKTIVKDGGGSSHQRFSITTEGLKSGSAAAEAEQRPLTNDERAKLVAMRFEIAQLLDELSRIFAEQPRVAKHVFTRVLTEEGIEVMARYIDLFGEGVVIDMLRDPSLQGDLTELMEFYAKNPTQMKDEEKLNLLRALHNRTVASKMFVMGNRSTNEFEFLAEMDAMQVIDLIDNESLTVKAIVLTQCDPQKRAKIYSQLDEKTRMKLLTELSRIDHLPKAYIFNVAHALKRKKTDNPKLNTEALPGSEVLVSLLERANINTQKSVIQSLEAINPDSARTVKNKLVSLDTLLFLRDHQVLELVLGLKHEELLQFLRGAPKYIRDKIFTKAPKELVDELQDELTQVSDQGREIYQNIERRIVNRMKVMANDGGINLIETNEKMFADLKQDPVGVRLVQAGPQAGGADAQQPGGTGAQIKKVAGW